MNVVPILTRELHCLNWRRTFYRQRLGVGMTASAVLLALALVDRFGGGISLMRMGILGPVLGILPFMVFILGLHGASELLAMERREGTLPLLLMTRVSGWDIIFGKLWQAVFTQGAVSLAAVPGLVLPLLAMGMGYTEFCYLVLAYANVVFFSLALGLLGAVFTDTRSAASWCLFFFLPVLVYSTPFTMFLPGGKLMQELALLQWVNPCAAVAQAPSAAAGFRSARFWEYLLVSHGVAWLLAGAAGWLLPFTTRRLAGRTQTRRWSWFRRQRASSFEMRAPLLERNPFLWLNSRDWWARRIVWLWVVIPVVMWGWFIWMIWAWRALNVAVVFVIAIAATWQIALLCMVPAQAARQILSDRLSGAFEVLLCTPATPKVIAQGIWLALRRNYLLPVAAVMLLSTVLMISGYVTFGFGGLMDPTDRPRWVIAWSTGIVFLPIALFALCWVSLRRTLFVRNVGEASAIALLQVFGAVGLVVWLIALLGGYSESWELTVIQLIAATLTFGGFAFRARRTFLKDLRSRE